MYSFHSTQSRPRGLFLAFHVRLLCHNAGLMGDLLQLGTLDTPLSKHLKEPWMLFMGIYTQILGPACHCLGNHDIIGKNYNTVEAFVSHLPSFALPTCSPALGFRQSQTVIRTSVHYNFNLFRIRRIERMGSSPWTYTNIEIPLSRNDEK